MLIIIHGGSYCDRVCALIQKPTEEISVATIIIVERNTLRAVYYYYYYYTS